MRGGPKTLVAVVALLLAVGLAACGGDSSSTSTEAAGQEQPKTKSDASQEGKAKNAGDESKPGSGDEGKSDSAGGGGHSASPAKFTPEHHSDSGGGSAQFRVKGGDNSIQEFGEEAGSSEFDEAATAVHNFLDARAAGNWDAACTYMAKSILVGFKELAARAQQLKDTSCGGILEKLTNPAAKPALQAEAAKADVRSLRIEGDNAFVIYTGLHNTAYAMPVAHEGGVWKVGSLAGTPIN